MATIEVKDSNPLGAIQELLRSMLDQGLVSAILVPRETPSKQTVAQTLIRDVDKLDGVNPLAPIFAVRIKKMWQGHPLQVAYTILGHKSSNMPVRMLVQQTGISLRQIQKLFPSGFARGACKVADIPSHILKATRTLSVDPRA